MPRIVFVERSLADEWRWEGGVKMARFRQWQTDQHRIVIAGKLPHTGDFPALSGIAETMRVLKVNTALVCNYRGVIFVLDEHGVTRAWSGGFPDQLDIAPCTGQPILVCKDVEQPDLGKVWPLIFRLQPKLISPADFLFGDPETL